MRCLIRIHDFTGYRKISMNLNDIQGIPEVFYGYKRISRDFVGFPIISRNFKEYSIIAKITRDLI